MAMDLLQAGVDRAVIALWLGHESVETTQIYLEATLAMKEQALAKTTPPTAERAVINPEINYSASSTACRAEKTMSGDRLTRPPCDLNLPIERDKWPISLDIVRKGR